MAGSKDEGGARKPPGGSGLVSKITNKLRIRSSSKAPTDKKDGNNSTGEGEPLISTGSQASIRVSDNSEPQAGRKSQAGNEPPVTKLLTAVSTSPLPATNVGASSKTRTSNEEAESSREDSSQANSVLGPIRELWNQAYDDLRAKEENLVKDYEAALNGNLTNVVPSESNIGKEDQMKVILETKLEEVKQNMWKLQFGASDVPVKDLVQPVVGIIDWANQYINAAVSANPYASLAWAGVGLLLPVSNSSSNDFSCLESRVSVCPCLLLSSLM
jgi:N-terminal domain of NWD NACHT-NTPase